MIVGVPTEVKSDEYRIGLRPVGAELLASRGHTVLVQRGAGIGSGYEDEMFDAVGAELVPDAEAVWSRADMIVKVKEPQPQEVALIRETRRSSPTSTSPPTRDLTIGCLESKCVAVPPMRP